MGQGKDTKKLNDFITPGLFPAHIVIWCPDWFSKKYQDLYFRKWVLDVESDFLLSDCIVSPEKFQRKVHRICPILNGYVDIRLSMVYMLTDEVIY